MTVSPNQIIIIIIIKTDVKMLMENGIEVGVRELVVTEVSGNSFQWSIMQEEKK